MRSSVVAFPPWLSCHFTFSGALVFLLLRLGTVTSVRAASTDNDLGLLRVLWLWVADLNSLW